MGGKIKVIYFSSIQLILFVYAGFGEKLSTYSLNKNFLCQFTVFFIDKNLKFQFVLNLTITP